MNSAVTGPVGVISNPNSGHNRDQFPAIRARLEACNGLIHRVTSSADEIGAALTDMRAAGVKVLAINGGDGTVSAILGELLESVSAPELPMIAILPGGTANMNAGDIGISGSLKQAVNKFSSWCEGDRSLPVAPAQRSLLRVSETTSDKIHYGMFLGAGAVIQGTDYAHREIHSRGLRDDFSLALGVIRTVWGVLRDDPNFNEHVQVELSLDGAPAIHHNTLILAISTLQRLAFGMRPFWSAEPGAIRVTLMDQGCSRFARTFFSIVRGKPSSNARPDSGYHSHNAQSLLLTLHGRINIDGEIIHCDGPMHINASEPLEFLQL